LWPDVLGRYCIQGEAKNRLLGREDGLNRVAFSCRHFGQLAPIESLHECIRNEINILAMHGAWFKKSIDNGSQESLDCYWAAFSELENFYADNVF
jgi:hypothetical protein